MTESERATITTARFGGKRQIAEAPFLDVVRDFADERRRIRRRGLLAARVAAVGRREAAADVERRDRRVDAAPHP